MALYLSLYIERNRCDTASAFSENLQSLTRKDFALLNVSFCAWGLCCMAQMWGKRITAVLLMAGRGWIRTWTQISRRENDVNTRSKKMENQGTPKTQGRGFRHTPEARRGKKGSPLKPLKRAWCCQHLSPRLLDPKLRDSKYLWFEATQSLYIAKTDADTPPYEDITVQWDIRCFDHSVPWLPFSARQWWLESQRAWRCKSRKDTVPSLLPHPREEHEVVQTGTGSDTPKAACLGQEWWVCMGCKVEPGVPWEILQPWPSLSHFLI